MKYSKLALPTALCFAAALVTGQSQAFAKTKVTIESDWSQRGTGYEIGPDGTMSTSGNNLQRNTRTTTTYGDGYQERVDQHTDAQTGESVEVYSSGYQNKGSVTPARTMFYSAEGELCTRGRYTWTCYRPDMIDWARSGQTIFGCDVGERLSQNKSTGQYSCSGLSVAPAPTGKGAYGNGHHYRHSHP